MRPIAEPTQPINNHPETLSAAHVAQLLGHNEQIIRQMAGKDGCLPIGLVGNGHMCSTEMRWSSG